jgi:hypothetical protein
MAGIDRKPTTWLPSHWARGARRSRASRACIPTSHPRSGKATPLSPLLSSPAGQPLSTAAKWIFPGPVDWRERMARLADRRTSPDATRPLGIQRMALWVHFSTVNVSSARWLQNLLPWPHLHSPIQVRDPPRWTKQPSSVYQHWATYEQREATLSRLELPGIRKRSQ